MNIKLGFMVAGNILARWQYIIHLYYLFDKLSDIAIHQQVVFWVFLLIYQKRAPVMFSYVFCKVIREVDIAHLKTSLQPNFVWIFFVIHTMILGNNFLCKHQIVTSAQNCLSFLYISIWLMTALHWSDEMHCCKV